MSDLSENVRKLRKARGWTQEQLAHNAGMSVGPVRNLEQELPIRMESLHAIARALGVETSALMKSAGAPEPVLHDANSLNLRELRIALTPAIDLVSPTAPPSEEPNLKRLVRMTRDNCLLYFEDSYQSVGTVLPELVRAANSAVKYYDSGPEQSATLVARSQALQLAGRYLTQIRQFDLAHSAIRQAILDAQAAGNKLTAASGVGGMCWLLMRTGRFNEAEDIAVLTMDLVEPRMRGATPDEYATWGGLAMEAAAAAARNNRPDEAKSLRRAASTAGRAVGATHKNLLRHWSRFGPVTVAIKELEDSMLIGDARAVVRKSAEEHMLQPKAWKRLGGPSSNDGNRHQLDLARAYVQTGDLSAGLDELSRLDETSPEWFRHQAHAALTFEELIQKRRTTTTQMRSVGAHLGFSS